VVERPLTLQAPTALAIRAGIRPQAERSPGWNDARVQACDRAQVRRPLQLLAHALFPGARPLIADFEATHNPVLR
jgi:hypothetical protein